MENNYGEEIENQIIRLSIERNSIESIRGGTNLISAISSVKNERELTPTELLNCTSNLAKIEQEIESSKMWLESLNEWRIKTYN